MYESLTVHGFRAFSSFDLPNLSRVNLFVGKNNSGKTSLLDAIEIASGGGRISSLLKSPRRRGEVFSEHAEERPRLELDVRHLFFGHRIEEGGGFEIVARTNSSEYAVRCTVRRGEPSQPELDLAGEQSELIPSFALVMTGPENVSGEPVLPLSSNGVLDYRRGNVGLALQGIATNIAFLGTDGPDPNALQQIWDRLVLTPEEEKVISAMRIIEPTIERLAFVSGGVRAISVAFVKLSGEGERVPLGSLGDGTRRLLALAIYMARAAGGILLIDEVDTGLHYTAMESMWRFVIQSARRLDVQVFATSHSGDCVRALAWLQTDAPELAAEVSVHRIDRSAAAAVRYSAQDIEVAARHHIEVRG